MYICKKCNKELKNAGAKAIHEKNCNGLGSKLDAKKEKQKEVCPKCGLRIMASKQKHYDTCNGFGPRSKRPKKGYHPWNKGLTKETNTLILKMSNDIKQRFKSGELIPGFKDKHLSEEHKEKLRKRTNFGINKRSKNEIYFAELCMQYFNNVKTNEAIFNGWDADVIIEDIKIAILWNGKWHYEKIMKEHSVKQVQNRDKIKIKEIKQMGYTPYIIKDMGRHNKEFVENEFEKFKIYIHTDIA